MGLDADLFSLVRRCFGCYNFVARARFLTCSAPPGHCHYGGQKRRLKELSLLLEREEEDSPTRTERKVP